jgi:hypothetical protein
LQYFDVFNASRIWIAALTLSARNDAIFVIPEQAGIQTILSLTRNKTMKQSKSPYLCHCEAQSAIAIQNLHNKFGKNL